MSPSTERIALKWAARPDWPEIEEARGRDRNSSERGIEAAVNCLRYASTAAKCVCFFTWTRSASYRPHSPPHHHYRDYIGYRFGDDGVRGRGVLHPRRRFRSDEFLNGPQSIARLCVRKFEYIFINTFFSSAGNPVEFAHRRLSDVADSVCDPPRSGCTLPQDIHQHRYRWLKARDVVTTPGRCPGSTDFKIGITFVFACALKGWLVIHRLASRGFRTVTEARDE